MSDMSNTTITVNESSGNESLMESLRTLQFSGISEHSLTKGTPTAIREWLMSLQPDSPASPSQSQENSEASLTTETCGPKPSPYFAKYDPDTHCWRTSQVCLLTNTEDEYSQTWPKAGSMQNGVCYPQPKWERRIKEIESGLFATMWPTPCRSNYKSGRRKNTPAFERRKEHSRGVSLCEEMQRRGITGQLNPTWVEWLMGWPIGWTDLKPLAMDRYRQ